MFNEYMNLLKGLERRKRRKQLMGSDASHTTRAWVLGGLKLIISIIIMAMLMVPSTIYPQSLWPTML